MIRTQVQLSEEQDQRLKALAALQHLSKAELVRQAVDLLLQQQVPPATMRTRWERAAAITGAFDSGIGDVAAHHDAYLAAAYGDAAAAGLDRR